jgi:hypothetical protein
VNETFRAPKITLPQASIDADGKVRFVENGPVTITWPEEIKDAVRRLKETVACLDSLINSN